MRSAVLVSQFPQLYLKKTLQAISKVSSWHPGVRWTKIVRVRVSVCRDITQKAWSNSYISIPLTRRLQATDSSYWWSTVRCGNQLLDLKFDQVFSFQKLHVKDCMAQRLKICESVRPLLQMFHSSQARHWTYKLLIKQPSFVGWPNVLSILRAVEKQIPLSIISRMSHAVPESDFQDVLGRSYLDTLGKPGTSWEQIRMS